MKIHLSHWKYNRALLLSWNIGAEQEQSYQAGFTHLAEHLMFYGPQGVLFSNWEQQTYPLFGSIEAKTSQNSLKIICHFSATDTKRVMQVLSQMVFNAKIDLDDLEIVKQEVQEEIDEYKSSQEYNYKSTIEKYIPYRHSPLGYEILDITYDICQKAQKYLQQLLLENPVQIYSIGEWSQIEVEYLTDAFSRQTALDTTVRKRINPEYIIQNSDIIIQKRGKYETIEDIIEYFWIVDRAYEYGAYFTTVVRQDSVYWVLISEDSLAQEIWDKNLYQEQKLQAIQKYYKNLLEDYETLDWENTLERMRYYDLYLLNEKRGLSDVKVLVEGILLENKKII